MNVSSPTDLYFDQLRDLHSMESQLTRSLRKVAEAAADPKLHELVEKHVEETCDHEARIAEIFERHGVEVGADKCKAIEGLNEGGENHLSHVDNAQAGDLMVIAHCLRVHHYGVASYGVAARLASRLNLSGDAEVLLSLLAEEEEAVQSLRDIEPRVFESYDDVQRRSEGVSDEQIFEVIILGGGPAGISAALLLGRCMRRVLLGDAGCADSETHTSTSGFIGHDGCEPTQIFRLGREQLGKFDTVKTLSNPVEDVEREGVGFLVRCRDGRVLRARAVLLTSGFVARLPGIPGAERFYGHSLHQCPYCDGWDHRGKAIGVLGADSDAVQLSIKLLAWSSRITLFTDGDALSDDLARRALAEGVTIVSGTITALEGVGSTLERIRTGGDSRECDALYFWVARKYHSSLAARLGCDFERCPRRIDGEPDGWTGIHGLFIAGNTIKTSEFAIVAAAEGIKVAESIHEWLLEADRSYLAV